MASFEKLCCADNGHQDLFVGAQITFVVTISHRFFLTNQVDKINNFNINNLTTFRIA
jgi:hypothetical protein